MRFIQIEENQKRCAKSIYIRDIYRLIIMEWVTFHIWLAENRLICVKWNALETITHCHTKRISIEIERHFSPWILLMISQNCSCNDLVTKHTEPLLPKLMWTKVNYAIRYHHDLRVTLSSPPWPDQPNCCTDLITAPKLKMLLNVFYLAKSYLTYCHMHS